MVGRSDRKISAKRCLCRQEGFFLVSLSSATGFYTGLHIFLCGVFQKFFELISYVWENFPLPSEGSAKRVLRLVLINVFSHNRSLP